MASIPNMNIASPPIKLMCLAYLIATLVPNVPISNQQVTATKLKPSNTIELTEALTP